MIEIDASDFGVRPDVEDNSLPGLQAAVRHAVGRGADRLVIPAGRYLLRDAEAVRLQEDALSGALGNPERLLFNRDYSYRTALDFTGARDLSIDATGVTFIMDGWLEPISFRNAHGVHLRGLTLDFRRPPNSEGVITRRGPGSITVSFDQRYPITRELPFHRVMVFDETTGRLGAKVFGALRGTLTAPQTMTFPVVNSEFRVGRRFLGWHGFHFRPAILIYASTNTVIEDVTIHANPGMGIVGHLATDTVLRRVRVVPRPGSVLSTNTDATHFVSCRGLLRFEDCDFAGHGDDATNVHGMYYQVVERSLANRVVLALDRGFETHSVLPDPPRVGDELAVVAPDTLAELGSARVLAVEPHGGDEYAYAVELDSTPPGSQDLLLINLTACPRLEFVGSRVRNNRARGVLIKTRSARVEGCSFEGCTGTAVHVGAEAGWFEGPASADVEIRGNSFVDCGFGDGTIEGASAVAVHVDSVRRDVPALHRRIRIIDNTVVSDSPVAFLVASAEAVVVTGNRLSDGSPGQIRVRDSVDVTVEGNWFGWTAGAGHSPR